MARRRKPEAKGKEEILYCSFCGKSQHELRKLIAGPTQLICDECIDLCVGIIEEEDKRKDETPKDPSLTRYAIHIKFERAFTSLEKKLIPAIVAAIETEYPELKFSIRNFYTVPSGAVLDLNFDSAVKLDEEQLQQLKDEIRHLSIQLKIAQEKYLAAASDKERFEKLYTELVQTVMPLMISQLRKEGELRFGRIRTLLVFFSDIVGFSKLSSEDRQHKLDLLRLIGRAILKSENGMYLNTWGDGVVAGFEDPTDGLRCACKFISHLNVDGLDARIGVNWGAARISYNEITDKFDIDGESVNMGARIEPLAEPGEVLASEVVISLEELDKTDFILQEKKVVLKKDVGGLKTGDMLNVYSEKFYPNS